MKINHSFQGAGIIASAFFLSKAWILILFISLSACAQPPSSVGTSISMNGSHSNEHIENQIATQDTLTFTNEELLGKFEPSKHPDFVRIDKQYTEKPNIYMRKEAYQAWIQMHADASKAGIPLTIISATRNFDYQKSIWERKWNSGSYKGKNDFETAQNILKYSSMPGTSRHHWGTDVDFNSLTPSYFTSGIGKKVYDWLTQNAVKYGFAQTYTAKSSGRTGYEEEYWHWSYMPLSSQMLRQYNSKISYSNLTGFAGSGTAEKIRVIEDYVNGISSELK